MLCFHAVVKDHRFVPLRERTFETSGPFGDFFEPQLHESVCSVELEMVIIGYFLSPSSLILESAEKSVSMHVDAGLLPEESLPIPSKPVKEGASDLSHLLHFELVLLFLKVFNSVK